MLLAGAAIPAFCGAQAVSWTHQAAAFQSNGAVTVKSLAGGSYGGPQNPTGAVAKSNQTAATQPPTILIQATGGAPFNYTTDCYILTINGISWLGAGKLDAANNFSGLVGQLMSGPASFAGMGYQGATQIMAMMTGAPMLPLSQASYSSMTTYAWCGNSAACLSSGSQNNAGMYNSFVIGVSAVPTQTRSRCYP